MEREINETIGLLNDCQTFSDLDIIKERVKRLRKKANKIEINELLVIEAALNILEDDLKEIYRYNDIMASKYSHNQL